MKLRRDRAGRWGVWLQYGRDLVRVAWFWSRKAARDWADVNCG